MNKQLKEIGKQMNKIKESFGIKAFQEIEHFIFTLYRKIEDLIKSRENWKKKYKVILIKLQEVK